MNLYDRLSDYSSRNYYPMHMPGHKRNTRLLHMTDPYNIDITEIDGFDNLHHAEGILKAGMERAGVLYGSAHTDYLIGGSTSGILTGISACTRKGDKVLAARNSHKSVYNAIYLNELEPVYIYPRIIPDYGISGGISPKNIEEMLIKHPDIKLVIITSPTYEGVLSDVKAIAEIVHRFDIPLMVDEAHGAHLGFGGGLLKNSVSLGADIVIHSIHKTLPAFTQTALIHTNGILVDYEEVKRYLSIYQTSSPSYILMSGIEQCITLLEEKGPELFAEYQKRLCTFYKRVSELKYLKVLTDQVVKENGFFQFDSSKIIVSTRRTNFNGTWLYDLLLHYYRIQMEMKAKDYVLGMTSVADTKEGFNRLGDALLEADKEIEYSLEKLKRKSRGITVPESFNGQVFTDTGAFAEQVPPERIMLCHEALKRPGKVILLSESIGRISAEYIYLYPPGIPLLVPGEKINGELLNRINGYQKDGLSLQGLLEMDGKHIKVVAKDH